MAVFTKTIEVRLNKCEGCGHEWKQRGRKRPKICPTCKRENWNIPRALPGKLAEAEGLR